LLAKTHRGYFKTSRRQVLTCGIWNNAHCGEYGFRPIVIFEGDGAGSTALFFVPRKASGGRRSAPSCACPLLVEDASCGGSHLTHESPAVVQLRLSMHAGAYWRIGGSMLKPAMRYPVRYRRASASHQRRRRRRGRNVGNVRTSCVSRAPACCDSSTEKHGVYAPYVKSIPSTGKSSPPQNPAPRRGRRGVSDAKRTPTNHRDTPPTAQKSQHPA
jgi:hypothetical protein